MIITVDSVRGIAASMCDVMHVNTDLDDTMSVTSLRSAQSDVTGLRTLQQTNTDTQPRLTMSTRSPLLKYFTPRLRAAGDYSQFIGIVRGFAKNSSGESNLDPSL